MTYKPVNVVEVWIWGRLVGKTVFDPNLRCYAFEYAPEFVSSGIELAPLMMPLVEGQPYVFPSLPELTYRGLPAMLSDALPDEFGNALIDRWMQDQGVRREDITPLDRLAYMGKRGVGALEFKPERHPKRGKATTALEMARLVEGARRALQFDVADDNAALAALQQLIEVGTSAGGARAKATVAWNPKTKELRAGQFDAPSGFEHWLLKFDGLGKDHELGTTEHYGRIEFAYSQMARAAGIEMMPCDLFEENGRAHFMTKRFDRIDGAKVHVQTLCAIAHLDYKQRATHSYLQYFQAAVSLGLDNAALEQAFRRMVFNVMACNRDDHTKNLAFLRRAEGAWELSPAYDLTHAFNPKGEWTHQHQLAVAGKFGGIDERALLDDAARAGLGRAPTIIAEVRDAVRRWPEFGKVAGLLRPTIDAVKRDFPVELID